MKNDSTSPRVSDAWSPLECAESLENCSDVVADIAAAEHLRDYAPIHAAMSAVDPDGGTWSEPDVALAADDRYGVPAWTSFDADGVLTVSRCYTEEFTPSREQARELAAALWAWADSQGGET